MNTMPNIFDETDLSEIFKNLDDQEYSDILKNGHSTDIAAEYGLNLNHLVDQINRAIQNTVISTNSRTQTIK